uniref:Uncharacterized protein n=1 Tax=Sphaerodactylus townsendi TaxID=933632 RepID=A0ACB8FT21_9SAUR
MPLPSGVLEAPATPGARCWGVAVHAVAPILVVYASWQAPAIPLRASFCNGGSMPQFDLGPSITASGAADPTWASVLVHWTSCGAKGTITPLASWFLSTASERGPPESNAQLTDFSCQVGAPRGCTSAAGVSSVGTQGTLYLAHFRSGAVRALGAKALARVSPSATPTSSG